MCHWIVFYVLHTINLLQQVQLIHWNKDLYKNIGEAIVGENGLCTIAVLYQVLMIVIESFE